MNRFVSYDLFIITLDFKLKALKHNKTYYCVAYCVDFVVLKFCFVLYLF